MEFSFTSKLELINNRGRGGIIESRLLLSVCRSGSAANIEIKKTAFNVGHGEGPLGSIYYCLNGCSFHWEMDAIYIVLYRWALLYTRHMIPLSKKVFYYYKSHM